MSVSERASLGQGNRIEIALMAGVILLAVGAFFYLSAQRQPALRESLAGLDGLGVWLKSNEIETRNFFGGWAIPPKTVGVNIIPLYDTELDRVRNRPATQEELLFQIDEYDQRAAPIREKAARVPTLIVLPKWRTGMRLTGKAHPILLASARRVTPALWAIAGRAVGPVRPMRQPFTRFTYVDTGGERLLAELYAAQVFEGNGCQPVIGEPGQMLLAECPLPDTDQTVLILADPDLLNNHGLRLGENAWIARDFIQSEASGDAVYIDYSRRNWFAAEEEEIVRQRSWSDLAQFFAYPFSMIWISTLSVFALFLWRGGIRFGPVPPEHRGMEASRTQVIRVRARLMRLTGQDGALISEYVTARISATATHLFGQNYAGRSQDEAAVSRHAARQSPGLANQLESLLAEIGRLPATLTADEAIRYVDDLETILEQLVHDT